MQAGIDDGQTIILRGEGDAGVGGGPAGDLLVAVRVRPHAIFERNGADLSCEFPITFVQATLGAEVEVPTLDGKVQYQIPAGTQSHTVFRLRGKGVQKLQSRARGDLFVRVVVEVPKDLSERQSELLREFEAASEVGQYSKRKSFFDKIKEAISK